MQKTILFFCYVLIQYSGWTQQPFGNFYEEFTTVPIGIDDGIVGSISKTNYGEDTDGVLWMTTEYGVLRFDGFQCLNFTKYLKSHFPDLTIVNQENTVYVDSLNQVWLGGQRGLSLYDLETNTYKRIFLDEPMYPGNLRNQVIRFYAKGDYIYVGTKNGVYILNITTHELEKSYLTNGKLEEEKINTSNCIQGVYPFISDSLIYIQVNDGMHIINKETDQERVVTAENLVNSEFWGQNRHWFYQGVVQDSTIISPSWNAGITHFDLRTEKFELLLPDPTRKIKPNRNIFSSLMALNDSVSIAHRYGRGLFSYEYPERKLIEIDAAPSFNHVGLFDSHGHYWAGNVHKLFRSNRQLTKATHNYRSLQLGEAFTNNRSLGYISLENLTDVELSEHEKQFKLYTSLTHSYDLTNVKYQFKIGKEWSEVNNNTINIENVSPGRQTLMVRVLIDNKIFDEKSISINRYIPWYKTWYYILALSLIIGVLIHLISQYRINQAIEKAKIKSKYDLKIAQLNTAALRSRMNPHFLFNTLNSIKHYALFKSKEDTSTYITEFSQLIRGILEYSELEYLSLEDDIKWVKNYISIEQKRFKDPFKFSLIIDPLLDVGTEKIPPLIIQPFIENAIWHGLYSKSEDKLLRLSYTQIEKGYQVIVEDNGIGREAAEKLAQKESRSKKSLGMKITIDRILQMNKLNDYLVTHELIDLKDDQDKAIGTKVIITFKHKS